MLNLQPAGRGYAHVIKEDTVSRSLLSWHRVWLWCLSTGDRGGPSTRAGIFRLSRYAISLVHSRESDLILATHGVESGSWTDISPLRALTPELMQKDAVLLTSRPAIQYMNPSGGCRKATRRSSGPSGRRIVYHYYQRAATSFGDLKIEIFDHDGKLLIRSPAVNIRIEPGDVSCS